MKRMSNNTQEVLKRIEAIEKKATNMVSGFSVDLSDGNILKIQDIKVIRPKLFDLDNEIDIKDKGSSLLGTIQGSLIIIDKNTGRVVKRSNNRKIVTIPYLTNRHTYIIGGKEKVITKQMRLKPGVYTYDKDSKVQSLMFLERGKNLYITFDPETFNLTLGIEKSTKNAITFFRILGITDAEIENAIADRKISEPLFRKAKSKNIDNEVAKLWQILPCKYWHEGGKYPGKTEAINDIRKYFFESSDFGDTGSKVMNITLGTSARHPDKEVFLQALNKIVKIAKAETQEEKDLISDNRDDIRFQNVLADEDQIELHIQYGLEEIEREIRRQGRKGKEVFDIFSYNRVNAPLQKFMSTGQLVDLVEQTNPLLMSAAKRKVTSLGEGGLAQKAASQETRNLENTGFGRLDPIETPESGKIGLVSHLTHSAEVKNLTIFATYYKVEGGKFKKIPSNKVKLEPLEEYDKYIAFYDPNTFKVNGDTITLPATVMARHEGRIELNVPRSKINFVDTDPHNVFGDAAATIPFSAHNDGNRMLMGSNMQKQALILENREEPLVQSAISPDRTETFEQKIARENSFAVFADSPGTVSKVTNKEIVVTNKKGEEAKYQLMHYFPLNMSNYINNTPTVKPGDTVKKGQLLAEGWQTKNGTLALGMNVRIAYMPWKGYNFEDGYVISESLAERMGTEELKEITVEIKEGQIGGPGSNVKSILQRLNVAPNELKKLDDDGIIKEGEEVNINTILVGIVEEIKELEEKPEVKLLRSLGTELEKQYRDKSKVIDGYIHGKVIRIKLVPQRGGDETRYIVKVTVLMKNKLKPGDKLAGRFGNKGIITKIEKNEDMPNAEDGEPIELIYSPLGLPSRQNLGQLYEANAGLVASKLGKPFKVYNFDKSEVERVKKGLESIGFPDGKMTLYDPETKKPYDNKVTVGNVYILKLKHKVDDKIQARTYGRTNFLYNTPVKSIGELAGEKVNPQKWGEMEMRALQASKAVNLIDEAVKLKADAAGGTIQDREAIFDALAFGNIYQVAGQVPQSLRVFKEYSTALGINVKPVYNGKEVQSLDSKFNALAIAPLKSKEVEKLSRGEVTKAGMFKAYVSGDKGEESGLFDPKIFGETREEKRTYWGHVNLGMPMPNPLLLNSDVNPYSALLGITKNSIKSIVTDKVGVITNPGDTGKGLFEVVPLDQITKMQAEGKTFEYDISGKALEKMLDNIDVKKEINETQELLLDAKPKDKPKLYKKLRILRMLQENNLKPTDLMVKALPIMPVAFRPFEKEKGSKQTIDDTNTLYKNLIQTNNKIKDETFWTSMEPSVKQEGAKDLYLRLEGVMGVNTIPITGPGGQEVKGLAKRMTGKEGLIRGRLMSKFLDYSGRSVITVNPSLGLDEAGLPVDIAKKLYQPFVIRDLYVSQKAKTREEAIEKSLNVDDPDTWNSLQKAVSERPIILNRAPSLHKYSIQAFNPKLTKARAIELNPLVITGFNADFDGDQMGVHIPLTSQAVKEAENLLMPSKNLINPTNGALITPIKGEAILGLYYLTIDKYKGKIITRDMAKKTYTSYDLLYNDYRKGEISPYTIVLFNNIPATVGQHLVNYHLPEKFRDYRRVLNQGRLSELIEKIIAEDEEKKKDKKSGGSQAAVVALNKLKDLGFLAATKSALSIGVWDLKPTKEREKLLQKADEIVAKDPSKIIDVYSDINETIRENTLKSLPPSNPLYMFTESGAKGNKKQVTRMSNMVGMSMDITGRVLPVPVKSSFKEGLSPAEFWVHAFDSRRGLADRSLSTAEPGALTRDIWSSTQDAIISTEDCGDVEGVYITTKDKSILGRYLAKPVKDAKGNVIYRRGTFIDNITKDAISNLEDIQGIHVRSPLTCKTVKGICQKCYGALPGTTTLPMIGEPVGILASQAIGEPTAQGTMKTFHSGGATKGKASTTQGFKRVEELFNISKDPKNKSVLSPVDGRIVSVDKDVVNKVITIEHMENGKSATKRIKVPLVKEILVKPGDSVTKGQRLTQELGAINPREILDYKGLPQAQEYLVNELSETLKDNNIDRRHIELAVGKLTEKVQVNQNAASPWLPGQVALRNQVERWNMENTGIKKSVDINETLKIVNSRAARTYKGFGGEVIVREGETITKDILGKLMALRIKKVEIYPGKVDYTPVMFGVTVNPQRGSENWFSQMGFEDIKQPFAEGAMFNQVDVLDEPRSRQMAGKIINVGEGYKDWKTKFDETKKKLGGILVNLFD